MQVNRLNEHYSFESPGTIYDEEALTALELCARTAKKVNECVDQVNDIPQKIADDVQAHIENGQFNQQIDEANREFIEATAEAYNNLNKRVDSLVGGTTGGSITERDSEVIDARLGEDGVTYPNLGTAIRTQFKYGMLWRTPKNKDANLCLDTAFYLVANSDNWANLPGTIKAGVLVVYSGTTENRTYQHFHDYNGNFYYRNGIGVGSWNPWTRIGKDAETVSLKNDELPAGSIDVDTITKMGVYRLSSAVEHNAPYVAGVLIVFNTGINTQLYQMFLGYNGTMHYRVSGDGFWFKWVEVASVNALSGGSATTSYEYMIEKVNDTSFYIYKPGTKGCIRYEFGLHSVSGLNLNTYRIKQIMQCDNNKNPIRVITDVGHDVEGVVHIEGHTDYLGGPHGYEVASGCNIFVDGKEFTLDSIENVTCQNISIYVPSSLYDRNTEEEILGRDKWVEFNRDGVHIRNRWVAMMDCTFTSIKPAMFSINKECFTRYYDSNVNIAPLNKPTNTSQTVISTNGNVVDMYFVGDVMAHHWVDEGEGSTQVVDYGDRVKTYFNEMSGFTLNSPNHVRGGTSHFYITC